MKQKFRPGDLVRIVKSDSIFREDIQGKRAIIQGSYNDLYGYFSAERTPTYSIIIEKWGSLAWVDEPNLQLIKTGCWKLYDAWKAWRR